MTHRRLNLIIGGLIGALVLVQALQQPAAAQAGPPQVQRLYILNCGEGVAGDISCWSPGVNAGKLMDSIRPKAGFQFSR